MGRPCGSLEEDDPRLLPPSSTEVPFEDDGGGYFHNHNSSTLTAPLLGLWSNNSSNNDVEIGAGQCCGGLGLDPMDDNNNNDNIIIRTSNTVTTTAEVRRRPTTSNCAGTSSNSSCSNSHNTTVAESSSSVSSLSMGGSFVNNSTNHNHPMCHGRILDRDGGFYQSRGKWSVQQLSKEARKQQRKRYCRPRRILDDWFHTLAYKHTIVLMTILFVSYTGLVMLFAWLYYALSVLGATFKENPDGSMIKLSFCDMDITNKMEAMYFSLSTMTTIGYGVSDYYFGDCWTPLLVVLCQVCCAITFDAVAIGLLFQRISRGRKRGKTIIFSNTAVIRHIRGTPYLMFRISELRRHQLVEANVRVYCIRHERVALWNNNNNNQPPQHHYQPQQQQQQHHHHHQQQQQQHHHHHHHEEQPPQNQSCTKYDENNHPKNMDNSNVSNTKGVGVLLEEAHFVTRHVKLLHPDEATLGSHILMSLPQVIVHPMDATSPLVPLSPVWYDAKGIPHSYHHYDPTSTSLSSSPPPSSKQQQQQEQEQKQKQKQEQQQSQERETITLEQNEIKIKQFLQDRDVEIIVLVEGTDELTGSAIQARHSYRYNDFQWNHTFQPCVFPAYSLPRDDNSSNNNNNNNNNNYDYDPNLDERNSTHHPNNNRHCCCGCCRCYCFGSCFKSRSYSSSSSSSCCSCCCTCGIHATSEPTCIVDYKKFHDTMQVPSNCEACPYVPSPS